MQINEHRWRFTNVLPKSTLEQWAVLRAVIAHGGFSAAALVLHRSQSSVSYAIGRLHDAIGVELVETKGRHTVLTEAGAALLAEVAPLIDELNRIEARGIGIAHGEAIRIRLLVDSLFPKPRLFSVLERFAEQYPYAELHLVETVRQTAREVDDFDLAILISDSLDADADRIADIRLMAVAQAAHPLFAKQRLHSRALLARYPCVEIRGIEPRDDGHDRQGRYWRMNTVEAAIDAVRHGLCYGWLPYPLIELALLDGTLRALQLPSGAIRHIPLALHTRDESALMGGAIAGLAALLKG
jgi:DNA-binding transcriptional LysR family regulator